MVLSAGRAYNGQQHGDLRLGGAQLERNVAAVHVHAQLLAATMNGRGCSCTFAPPAHKVGGGRGEEVRARSSYSASDIGIFESACALSPPQPSTTRCTQIGRTRSFYDFKILLALLLHFCGVTKAWWWGRARPRIRILPPLLRLAGFGALPRICQILISSRVEFTPFLLDKIQFAHTILIVFFSTHV